jgi:ABC-2 type transport system permease protein
MSKTLLIARRELGAYRRSWLGPIVIAATMLADGLFFYVMALTKPMLSAEALGQFFFWAGGIGAVAAVFLSMRLVAEERQTGTITLLNTAPVSEWEIVLGKYLALLAVVILMTAFTCYMPLWLMVRCRYG